MIWSVNKKTHLNIKNPEKTFIYQNNSVDVTKKIYFSYGSFMGWIGLRGLSFLMVQKERFWDNLPPEEIWLPRDHWYPFDPFLLAEGNQKRGGYKTTQIAAEF